MWILLVVLIALVSLIYLASMQGITCCNSGSMFALVKAIVKKKKLAINDYIKYASYKNQKLDYSDVNGRYYTDRPPGTSFAAIPIYILGWNVTLISVISGVLSTALVYLITFQLVNVPIIAFFTALIFAFCTINWKYSILFFLHSLSTFLVLLAVYGFLVGYSPLIIGVVLGLATIVEYTNFMYFFGVALSQIIFGNFLFIPFLGVGYAIGITPLLIYNAACFGSPFVTSYKYSAHFKWSNSPKTTFVTPLLKGVFGLLFFIKKKDNISLPGGILVMSPVLIFGIIGFFYLPLKVLVLFLCLCVPLFLLISKHKTYWAGGAGDHRYLASMIPYLAIPIGLTIKNLIFLWPLILILALFSCIMATVRILTLTVKIQDLKKIKKDRSSLLEFVKPRYAKKLIVLIFKGLFVRKIHLENQIYKEKSKLK